MCDVWWSEDVLWGSVLFFQKRVWDPSQVVQLGRLLYPPSHLNSCLSCFLRRLGEHPSFCLVTFWFQYWSVEPGIEAQFKRMTVYVLFNGVGTSLSSWLVAVRLCRAASSENERALSLACFTSGPDMVAISQISRPPQVFCGRDSTGFLAASLLRS